MAIKTKEEILSSINALVGENTDDNVLSIIEDVTDTIADYESKTADATDWKQKYEDNDREWRQRYKERFMSSDEDVPDNNKDNADESTPKPMSFEDLFKVKE